MSDIASLLERFRRGPELLAVVLTGVYGEEEDFVTAPGKWSVRQIIAHLADTELVMGVRIRLVAAQENPPLTPFDQDAWARNLDYARRKPKHSLETLRRLRAENYELIKDLPAEAFERQGMHAERGPLTLQKIVETCANHVESHARQMQEIREQYKAAKGKK
ncbi:MAG: DinB family protein [Acidobacteria bacterium]|nr:DinB family protein [Acidobacteriota bacterium]